MHVEHISDFDSLTALSDDWNRLAIAPFCGWDWMQIWWNEFHDTLRQGRLSVLAVRDQRGCLTGLAPFYREQSPAGGTVLRLLSGDAKTSVCPDHLSLICQPELVEPVCKAVAQWLFAAQDRSDDRWDLIDLRAVDARDGPIQVLVGELAARGGSVYRRPSLSTWAIALPSDWDEYVEGLSKNNRKKVRKIIRKVFDSGQGVLRRVESEADLEQGLEILKTLHQKRARFLQRDGCFDRPKFTSFFERASRQLLERGELGMCWFELDGRPVAADWTLERGQVTYAFQSGLDPEVLNQQPGHLSHIALIRRAIERGCHTFDFLRGDEPYKAQLGAVEVEAAQIRIAARRRSSRLRHQAWIAGQQAKSWVKQGITRARGGQTAMEEQA